jgi:hypothetical protein
MVPCNLTLMGIEAVTKVEGALSVLYRLALWLELCFVPTTIFYIYHPLLKSLP